MAQGSTDAYAVIKSSIDWAIHEAVSVLAAQGYVIPVAEIEDVTQAETILKDAYQACVYQLVSFDESPRAPRYSVMFNVGAKTKDDNANLALSALINSLKSQFATNKRVTLRDFSGVEAGEPVGAMLVTSAGVAPQVFDKQQGIRMITCHAMAVITHGS